MSIIGKKFELWQSEYTQDAYEDQMGLRHDATVVRRRAVVTVTGTEDTKSDWTNETVKDGLWIAQDDAGVQYTQRLDETSMSGRYVWWDSLSRHWHMAQSRGWLTPFMNPDGTKAVPLELNKD